MSRFEQALHYVVANTRPEELGKVKLAKVLFFADLESFRRTGHPITEATYEKRQHGPMPRELYLAVDRLQAEGKIAQRKADHFGYKQHQFWALSDPEFSDLSAQDVAWLSTFIRAVCDNHTAASISDFTHNAAWELATVGEQIPFAAFLAALQSGKATQEEIQQIEAALGV